MADNFTDTALLQPSVLVASQCLPTPLELMGPDSVQTHRREPRLCRLQIASLFLYSFLECCKQNQHSPHIKSELHETYLCWQA